MESFEACLEHPHTRAFIVAGRVMFGAAQGFPGGARTGLIGCVGKTGPKDCL